MPKESANTDKSPIECKSQFIDICVVGPDRPGLLERITSLARAHHVELRHNVSDVYRQRAVLFFGCEGNDDELNGFCRSLERALPGEGDDSEATDDSSAWRGYSVDVHDVAGDVDGPNQWSRTTLYLHVAAPDAIGLLASVAQFISQQGCNMSYSRSIRRQTDDETTHPYSYHTIELHPPISGFDRQAFERQLLVFKENQVYDRCELRDY